MSVQIDEERCVGCGCCIDGCNSGALEFHPEKEKVWVNEGECIECKSCIELCPEEALSV
ncbi:MAG: 4Fe-4S binding protein [Deltaproteobacteria bacterium]|nr:4Fe-4S binding protein [Deltaproteobacteria bacterium]